MIAEALNGAVDKFWRIFWMTMVNRIMPEAMPAVAYFYTPCTAARAALHGLFLLRRSSAAVFA